jgi:hypothetical protein
LEETRSGIAFRKRFNCNFIFEDHFTEFGGPMAAKKFPTTFNDEKLGTFELVHKSSGTRAEYATKIALGDSLVKLVVYSNERTGDMEESLTFGRELHKSAQKVLKSVNAFIKAKILPSLNKTLFASNPRSFQELLKMLTLVIVDVHADGRATFSFETGDSLDGHSLVLFGKSTGEIEDFDLPG